MLIHKIITYGCLGLLLEVFFTGLHSLYIRNYKATSTTFLWMIFIYGFAGVTLEWLHLSLGWHPVLMALVYVPVIYTIEFTSGWALEKVIGACPWNYGAGKHVIAGYIRLDYIWYWYAAALGFDYIVPFLNKFFTFLLGGV